MTMYRRNSSNYNDIHSTAVRMMLIGTEQGTQLRHLMKRFSMRDIFTERDDPANRTFSGDYISVLRLSRTFDPAFMKSNVVPVIEAIILLQRAGFFRGRFQCYQDDEPQVGTIYYFFFKFRLQEKGGRVHQFCDRSDSEAGLILYRSIVAKMNIYIWRSFYVCTGLSQRNRTLCGNALDESHSDGH